MTFSIGTRRARMIEELNAASEVAETARGPVEFARRGAAPYVMIFHGTPQGHQASFIGEPFEAAGFGTITPSRPGYLRTPLETGRTFEEQADAAAALLDALAIDEAAAYAVSGGGPSGIQFAARHPQRVRALILEAAISQTYEPQVSALAVALFRNSLFAWIQGRLLQHFPRFAVGQLINAESTLEGEDRARAAAELLGSAEKLAFVRRVAASVPPFGLVRAGFDNDLEQFHAGGQLPLARVSCPALVVHGTHDRDVPFSHAEHSARGIAGAQLHRVEKGWHLLAMTDAPDDYVEAEVEFLRRHFGP